MSSSGQRDRLIHLQTAEKSQDATGQVLLTWPPDAGIDQALWAAWIPEATRETYSTEQTYTYVDGFFEIPDIDPRPSADGTRILFQGRIFDLKPYIEIGRGRGLKIPVVAHGE